MARSFVCPRGQDDRARLTEILRRPPRAGDVEEILCGPLSGDLPEGAQARSRLTDQFETNHQEFMRMVESILSTKEDDEPDDQAFERTRGIERVARQ